MTGTLAGRTLYVSGASRGIGLAIALRAARDGANVAIVGKTDAPHEKLPGTVHSAAALVEAAGGRALPLVADVRDEAAIAAAVRRAADHFGGIDICVNSASAIDLTGTEAVAVKRFDLMQSINLRGTFLTSRACVPFLRRSANPHILTLAPPVDLAAGWLGAHLPYSLSKYGMAMVALGLAEELRAEGIASNCLWPRTTIATAAVEFALGGGALLQRSRTPEIMADAAWQILTADARTVSGRCLIDDEVLAAAGETDFDRYRIDPAHALALDIFVDPHSAVPPGAGLDAVLSGEDR